MSQHDEPARWSDTNRNRCLYVIGMHRSGTSAVTGLLFQMGLHGPAASDLVPASEANPRGNNESVTLNKFNNQLLRVLGGSWSAPPRLEPGWDIAPSLDEKRMEAARLSAAVFNPQPFVWKDPRNCILLPFWRSVLGPPVAAIYVTRDRFEVAGSLQARNGFTVTHGLALWERYIRSSLLALDGIPTLVLRYDELFESTSAWCRRLIDFLHAVGLDVDPASADRAAASLDAGLRHKRATSTSDPRLAAGQLELVELLERRSGAHSPWSAPALTEEPGWVEDVLAMRRSFEQILRERPLSQSLWARAQRRLASSTARPG
ncbi:MAG TPA: hypothetical protein VG032_13070 [Acidimicrobiales bacterium]|jgi:hypothetical protein|nr:hypothetical protein [Acidimicrobiales bacterium]